MQNRAAACAPPDPDLVWGSSDAAVTRAARVGDGWMAIMAADAQAEQKLGALREQLKSFGRDPATFGIEGWLRMHSPVPGDWAAAADGWRRLGADMVMLYPMYRISNFDGQIEILRRFKEVASGKREKKRTPAPERLIELLCRRLPPRAKL